MISMIRKRKQKILENYSQIKSIDLSYKMYD